MTELRHAHKKVALPGRTGMTKRTGKPEGRPKHTPTKETRLRVQLLAILGKPHHDIAKVIGTGTRQLLREYRDELKFGKTMATMNMAGALYKNGIKGNVTAQIFWMKTQGGTEWHERYRHEHGGIGGKPIAHAVASAAITDDDAMRAYHEMVSGGE